MRADRDSVVEMRRDAAGLVVAPRGELDFSTVPPREVLRRHSGTPTVLDLRGVSFIDSAGLHLIFEEHQRAARGGIEFPLVRGPKTVQRLCEWTGLSRHLRRRDGVIALAADGGTHRP
jgi:anti-anti-sigma factor